MLLPCPSPPAPPRAPRAVLWFLFLLVYGAFPITLSTDLYLLFVGSVANSVTFWLTLVVVPACCVLPVFFWQQIRRWGAIVAFLSGLCLFLQFQWRFLQFQWRL